MRSSIIFALLSSSFPTALAFPVCHICPLGDHSMSRNGNLNTGLKSYTCSEAKAYGLNGELGDNSCLTLQMYANADTNNPCGCDELQTYPVANTNPVCDLCEDRTVVATINGVQYQQMSIYEPNRNKDVDTMLGQMPCSEILELAKDQWLPEGTCGFFQDDAKAGGCCTLDDAEDPYKAPPAPVPAPAPDKECKKSKGTCADDDDCCNGFECSNGKCAIKGKPYTQTKKSILDGAMPWDRKLLRGRTTTTTTTKEDDIPEKN